MRYNQIRECDIANGEGIGCALFVQGCNHHCFNCFNPETWDFNGGKEWTEEIESRFLKLASKPYIKRISILGGEPLAEENLEGVLNLVNKICLLFPEKTIWLYSGYTWEEIMYPKIQENFDLDKLKSIEIRKSIILKTDILVDGLYIDSQRNITLKWRGSANQRVINVKQSILADKIVLAYD